jgi:hypothetical protein
MMSLDIKIPLMVGRLAEENKVMVWFTQGEKDFIIQSPGMDSYLRVWVDDPRISFYNEKGVMSREIKFYNYGNLFNFFGRLEDYIKEYVSKRRG